MIDTIIRIFLKAKNKLVIWSIEIIKEAKNVRFLFSKKTFEIRFRHRFNGEQQKVIEMKGIILVKVDEM